MTGQIYSGINNIFNVKMADGHYREARLKGKVLSGHGATEYNPLAPGDRVSMEGLPDSTHHAMIVSRLPRHNAFRRWNRKRNAWQTVAANLERLFVVTSVDAPPFRPRFVERVFINCQQSGIPVSVVATKTDLVSACWVRERLELWESLGISVHRVSVHLPHGGTGMAGLREELKTGTQAFFGPSGVGKSTLLNYLIPNAGQTVGEISVKYNRGRHVTNFGRVIEAPWGALLIDTPGVREILVHGIAPENLENYFLDFIPWKGQCGFSSCSHIHEPDCAVLQALANGHIHRDRYDNYRRIHAELVRESRSYC